jgi:Zn-dependent alcohol dehydrogenase
MAGEVKLIFLQVSLVFPPENVIPLFLLVCHHPLRCAVTMTGQNCEALHKAITMCAQMVRNRVNIETNAVLTHLRKNSFYLTSCSQYSEILKYKFSIQSITFPFRISHIYH